MSSGEHIKGLEFGFTGVWHQLSFWSFRTIATFLYPPLRHLFT
jgi:hypothetical protein